MMKYQFISFKLAVALLLVGGISFAGQPFGVSKDTFKKAATNDHYMAIDINNVFSYYINNGDGALNPYTDDDGFELLNANRGQMVFEEGFVWGGIHRGYIKVGGSSYSHSLQAGPIVTPGTATTDPVSANAADPQYRVYRVRPDIGPNAMRDAVSGLLSEEVGKLSRYEGTTVDQLYAMYVKDWNEWPAAQGAPYTDVNHNGVYEPSMDIPGVPGASQTLWYVANDLDPVRANSFHRTKPIGIEFQRTVWAYNRTGALGSTIFQKNILINKSGFPVDSMFVAQWVDPDLGGALGYLDDFVGCDTTRSVGFGYNADNDDGFFGSTPPAIGFDFFQGPRVKTNNPTDKAIWKGQTITGYKNLPMTAFNFSVNSSAIYADATENSAAGVQEWYNLLNGLVARTGTPYTNPVTGKVTKFTQSGDPVTGKGWIDGQIAPPGDRRMSLCSGPFTLAPGDTQEVVVAAIAARSTNRLASLSLLKYYDALAQSAYDAFFQIANPPEGPVVSVTQSDRKIVLDWGSVASVQAVEVPAPKGYKFEGYNVYQLPGNGFVNQKLLATYDITDGVYTIADEIFSEQYGAVITVPVQNGNDLGVSRYFVVEKDYINDCPLVNGQTYYFAVTAYNYNPDPKAVPVTTETAPRVLAVVPQVPAPGVQLGNNPTDTLSVTHTAGTSDGVIAPIVLDPMKLTGNTYKVTFDTLQGQTFWNLTNVSTGMVLLQNQNNMSGDNAYFSVDGFLLKIMGPLQPGMKAWSVPAGERMFTSVGGFTGLGLEGFSNPANPTAYNQTTGTIGMAGHFNFGGIGTTLTASGYKNVLLKFAATDTGANLWNPLATPTDPNVSKGYRYLRNAATAPADPSFAPWIINATTGYPYQDFNYSVPFSAWDMETNPPMRLAVGHLENNVVGASVDGRYWPPVSSIGDNTVNRELAFIFDKPYSETVDPTLAVNMSNNKTTPLMWVITANRRTSGPWAAGNEFLISAYHPMSKADVYTFTPAAPITSVDGAKADVVTTYDLKQNYPNPFNPSTTISYQLPVSAHVTLKIFDLLGREVATLVDGAKQAGRYTAVWNAQNNSSGVYFYRIKAGSYTMTKKLMLMR